MQILSLPLQLTAPPDKRRLPVVAIATACYAVLQLTLKLLSPSAHERSETLLHLLAEVAFQTLLFAAFFTFLRFILPRNKRNSSSIADENQAILQIRSTPSVRRRDDSTAKDAELTTQSSR